MISIYISDFISEFSRELFLNFLASLPESTVFKHFVWNRCEPVILDFLCFSLSRFFDSRVKDEIHSVKELVRLKKDADAHELGELADAWAGDGRVDDWVSDDHSAEEEGSEVCVFSEFVSLSVTQADVSQHYSHVHCWV